MTLADLIDREARAQSLDRDLVAALVHVESGGDAHAYNPEPRYRYFWDVKKDTPFRPLTPAEIASKVPPADFPCFKGDRDQEWWAQQASWGLMQLMGAVARERGFRRPYLSELTEPEINLAIGCALLAALLVWAGGDEAKALGAYNAGKGGWDSPLGTAYAAKVLKVRREMAD